MYNIEEDILNLPDIANAKISPEMHRKLTKARKYIMENHSDVVSGLWFLLEPNCDGEPQVLIRTSLKNGTEGRINLEGMLRNLFSFDVIYDFNVEIAPAIYGYDNVTGQLIVWLREKRAVTIYDKDKEFPVRYVASVFHRGCGEQDFDITNCSDIAAALDLAKRNLVGMDCGYDSGCYGLDSIEITFDDIRIDFSPDTFSSKDGMLKISFGDSEFSTYIENFLDLGLGTRKEIKSLFRLLSYKITNQKES